MSAVRRFDSGATRDGEVGKADYEGFLSPEVLVEFGKYMDKNRHLADGSVRDSDNWQQMFGPTPEAHCTVCMKSLLRHVIDLWLFHRDKKGRDTIEDALGGLLFNTMAYWFGLIRKREAGK